MEISGSDLPPRMSEVEALMWALDADPHLSSNFANVTVLDRVPDLDRLRRTLGRAVHAVPLLGARPVESPGPLPPRWEPVEHLDLDHHVRHEVLPAGSGLDEVLRRAAALTARRFDPDRPLWEFVVYTGLPGGQAAMVQKLHHTITDGKGGIRMSLAFVDLKRDAPERPEPPTRRATPPEPPGGEATEVTDAADPAERSGTGAGPLDAVAGAVGSLARRGLDTAGTVAVGVADAVRDPASLAATLAGLPAETAAMVRSLLRQLAVVDRARSPLWTERSLRRELHVFHVPLDAVRATGKALGVTVNDLFVAAVAGGAGAYHRERGAEVDELRLSMPVSTRTDRAVGGNAFAPTRVLVPLDADPRRRVEEVHRRLAVTKEERALGATGALARLVNLVPGPILVRAARQQVATVDLAASNVRAAPFDLYIAGALMLANHPIGPLGGTACNITTMSYRGDLDVGVHVDPAAVTEPAALAAAVEAAFHELLTLG